MKFVALFTLFVAVVVSSKKIKDDKNLFESDVFKISNSGSSNDDIKKSIGDKLKVDITLKNGVVTYEMSKSS